MSVGLSQVNFDAQALEDEEEAALEKEDQEREQEIRELLTNELDDDLLDDDNASFSSHDFRSSANGTGTPYSEICPESPRSYQQDEFIGFQSLPSHRGAFERLPLITPRGFQLIQQPNDRTQVPHLNRNDGGEQYHNGRFNQKEGDSQRRENSEDVYQHDKNNNDGNFRSGSLTPEEFISGDNYSSHKSGSDEDYASLHGYQDSRYQDGLHHLHDGRSEPVDPNNYYGANGIHKGHAAVSPSGHGHHWTEYDHSNYDAGTGQTGYQQRGVDSEGRPGIDLAGQHYSQDSHQGRGREGQHTGNYTVHYKGQQSHQLDRDGESQIRDIARGMDADIPQ